MRIRKNAKISTLLNTNTNVVLNHGDECLLQKNLCQLNQSPWDIITFPSSDSSSSFHQLDDNEFYYNVSLAGNGIPIDSSGDFDSSVPSVKNFEGENSDFVDPKNDYEETLMSEGVVTNDNQEEIMLCDKTDDKGWQCGKVVKNGERVCDDHHQAVKLQNNALCTTTKKKPKPKPKRVHGDRSQTRKQASTNPYEFYYYSGFGPSWGKKRGTGSTGSNEPNKIKETSLTNDKMDIQNEEEGKLFESEVSKAGGPTKMELAYMDGDDDDDDDKKKRKTGINGKKRGRKPIKARSLKSLM